MPSRENGNGCLHRVTNITAEIAKKLPLTATEL